MSRSKFRKEINSSSQILDTGWDRYFSPIPSRRKSIRKRFAWMETYIVGPRLLDIGCGSGVMCQIASGKKEITEIHGIDLQENIIKQAKLNINSNKVQFSISFAENLPFKDSYFDTVVLGETLEHVYDEKETVVEALRVLKPGGVLIITVPTNQKLGFGHIRAFDEDVLTKLVNPYFTIKELFADGKYLYCMGKRGK